MTEVAAQHLIRSVPNVVERITLKLCVEVVQNMTNLGQRKDQKKGKKFHEINELENNEMDDLQE